MLRGTQIMMLGADGRLCDVAHAYVHKVCRLRRPWQGDSGSTDPVASPCLSTWICGGASGGPVGHGVGHPRLRAGIHPRR